MLCDGQGEGEERQDQMSVGRSSSVNTGVGHLPSDVIIQTLSSAVRNNTCQVEWFLPLLSQYIKGRLLGSHDKGRRYDKIMYSR